MMRTLAARSAIGLAAAAMFWSASVQALGLGEVEVRSRLNERFSAAIPVVSASAADLDSLIIEVAPPEAFARSGVDRADAVSGLSFTRSGNGIRVSSRDPIRDPFLTFIVEARWNGGRLLREYTVLLDPPESAPAAKPSTASTTVAATPTPLPLPGAAPAPLPGRYGPVQPNQTLWSIAKLLTRDPGVSQEQMLLALYNANPQAFVSGDIDQLLKGSMLKVPTAAEARAVDAASARDRVQQLRDAMPLSASEITDAPKPASAPVAAPAVPAPAAAPAAVSAPAAEAAPVPAAGDPAVTADPAAATADGTAALVEPAAEPVAEAPAAAVVEPAPQPEPAAAVEEAPAPAPAPPVDEDSTPWPLVGGLLVLLLALIAVKRRGRKEPEAAPPLRRVGSALPAAEALPPGPDALMERKPRLPAEDDAATVLKPLVAASDAEVPAAADEALPDDVKSLGLGVDASDPMTEADFHLAYGLYDEAAQMLKAAIANDPERGELKVKLAEVFSAAGNAAEFRALAEGMAGKATPAEWQRVSTMGRAILPDLSLFQEAAPAAAATVVPTAPLADVLRDLSVIDFDLDADVRRVEPAAAAVAPVAEPAPPAVDPLRDALMEPLEELPLPPMGEPLEAALLKPALDFSLPPPVTVSEPIPAPVAAAAPVAAPPTVDAFAELDLSSFDLEDDGAGKPADPNRVEFTMADLDAAAAEPLVLEPESTVIGGDEIDTKLDLARAYADMEDVEAARTLLDEVLAGGNERQQQDARALRQRLVG